MDIDSLLDDNSRYIWIINSRKFEKCTEWPQTEINYVTQKVLYIYIIAL